LGGNGASPPLLENGHQAHFENDFLATFAPITESVGTQISQLPIASPSSGFNFTYDVALKTFVPSTEETLGPILGERATTIGKNKVFVAFSYQRFEFDTIDGQGTGNIPAVFEHQTFPPPFPPFVTPCLNQAGLPSNYAGNPCFVRDFIQTRNNIDLRVNQYTFYITYGITKHLDVSAAIPILNIRMNVTSDATIVPNSVAPLSGNFPGQVFHQFNPATVSSCAGKPQPCLNATFSDSQSSTGIGDVILRGKYEIYHGERLGVAAGLDLRLPSGDAENFQGTGTAGVQPFGVVSYRARISPHAVIGYEINGESILAGNNITPLPPGTTLVNKASLPNRFLYTVGADASITKRLTAAFDILGERFFDAPRLVFQPFTDFGKCGDLACSSLTPGTTHPNVGGVAADFNETNASFGLKLRTIGKLVVTGNVLVRLDSNGLRAKAVPLVGVSYSF
jgi:hypothetical protein